MAEIEKVLTELDRLKLAIKIEDSDRGKINIMPCISTIDEAIQTIRELQELNKGLSESYTSNPMYEIGYKKGASDMEKAKQIIIDKLQNQIPKLHLVADGDLPKDDTAVIAYIKREITDVFMMVNISSISGKWQMWESSRDLYDDEKVIAWCELPKIKVVE